MQKNDVLGIQNELEEIFFSFRMCWAINNTLLILRLSRQQKILKEGPQGENQFHAPSFKT